MNIWTFTGRLGNDAELRTTSGGTPVLGFRCANDVGFGDNRTTQWVDCSIWGKRAEALAPHLVKGTKVTIAGELTLREFEKRDGTKGSTLSVKVSEIDLTGGGEKKPGGGGGYAGSPYNGNQGGNQGTKRHEPPPHDDLDDEIPF